MVAKCVTLRVPFLGRWQGCTCSTHAMARQRPGQVPAKDTITGA
jgi:hypothetical protein